MEEIYLHTGLNAYSLIFPDHLILQGEMNFGDESSPGAEK